MNSSILRSAFRDVSINIYIYIILFFIFLRILYVRLSRLLQFYLHHCLLQELCFFIMQIKEYVSSLFFFKQLHIVKQV